MMVNVIYPHQEISRIMTAAVVSLTFRKDLLQNPMNAIARGFGDETFLLERDQAEQISKIHATTLEEFASKIVYT
jgi:hypothetical protein